jgi:hypothetical protein
VTFPTIAPEIVSLGAKSVAGSTKDAQRPKRVSTSSERHDVVGGEVAGGTAD